MELSREKQQILEMSDEEVKRLLRLARETKASAAPPSALKTAPDLDALLRQIVGLEEPKQMLRRIVAYHRLQAEAASRGLALGGKASYHMCFTGNPGTAKTSYARFCAKILLAEGLLSNSVFYEAGRADLVALYSGQTAPRVRDAFDKAKGGVLFIDEAYSLVEDQSGGFGDEAIATLVQEMENRRDVIVVLAGYPDRMETFLSRNPGLKSRISFVVHFPDYSCDELVRIAGCIAARSGFRIDPGAEPVIRSLLQPELGKADFGNARFVRNLVEAAQMNRACALFAGSDLSALPDSELLVLRAEDFTAPRKIEDTLPHARAIGFTAG